MKHRPLGFLVMALTSAWLTREMPVDTFIRSLADDLLLGIMGIETTAVVRDKSNKKSQIVS